MGVDNSGGRLEGGDYEPVKTDGDDLPVLVMSGLVRVKNAWRKQRWAQRLVMCSVLLCEWLVNGS